jgi:hypothetical protein
VQKLLTFTLAFTIALAAAKKERDWKTGHVMDSSSSQENYVAGAVTNTSGRATGSATTTGGMTNSTATGHSTSTTSVQRVFIKTNELLIVGDGYSYVIEDSVRTHVYLLAKKLANHNHGCRFIVNEDIKYSQEKGDLWVLDADGKECKTAIIRQEKRLEAGPPK